MMNFEGKVYIVTGAGSGMGKSCCEKLIENKAWVIGIDINATGYSIGCSFPFV